MRYLIYVVLHEVAHAIKMHRSPKIDRLSKEDYETQEREADETALAWFNDHVRSRWNVHLKPISPEDVKAAQAQTQATMKRLYEGE